MEAYNIDDRQIKAGLTGSQFLNVKELNRLDYFRAVFT